MPAYKGIVFYDDAFYDTAAIHIVRDRGQDCGDLCLDLVGRNAKSLYKILTSELTRSGFVLGSLGIVDLEEACIVLSEDTPRMQLDYFLREMDGKLL